MAGKFPALFATLLLLAATMPLATAHLAGPSAVSDALTGDGCRGHGTCTTDGVSGNYVNDPSNLYLTSSALPVVIPDQTGGITGEVIMFPFGFASVGSALCDLEVLGDGSTQDPLDESDVDGSSGGIMPDGTWDDGGIGGACHMDNTYDLASYNTPGCGGTAFAKDAVSGGQVWIGASCDQTTSGSSPSLGTCITNEAISGASPAGLADCINSFLAGGTGGQTTTCGSDGVADAINYGTGGVGVVFPSSSGCPGGSAAVFTFNYMDDTPSIVPATAGWISSLATDGGTDPQCSDGVDNDGDGYTDYPDDPGCNDEQDDQEQEENEPKYKVKIFLERFIVKKFTEDSNESWRIETKMWEVLPPPPPEGAWNRLLDQPADKDVDTEGLEDKEVEGGPIWEQTFSDKDDLPNGLIFRPIVTEFDSPNKQKSLDNEIGTPEGPETVEIEAPGPGETSNSQEKRIVVEGRGFHHNANPANYNELLPFLLSSSYRVELIYRIEVIKLE